MADHAGHGDHGGHGGHGTEMGMDMKMDTGMDTGMDMGGGGGGGHMAMDHASIGRNPDGSYYYTHGAFLGHIVPVIFFIIWGTWWLVALFDHFLTTAAFKHQFRTKSWYRVFFGPVWLRRIPLEPLIKVILPTFGILGELWLGHPSWRTLIAPDGKFVVDNINDWQHSTMYLAFVLSGVVDMIGHYSPHSTPEGTSLAFVSLAFLVQGVLLVFHLKGPAIEVMVHLILVLVIFATFISCVFEGFNRGQVLVGSLRPLLTLLQGVWWVQTAFIMFVSDPAYDPEYMGGTMMVPAVFVVHMMWLCVAGVVLLGVMSRVYSKRFGREIDVQSVGSVSGNGVGVKNGEYRPVGGGLADLELSH